MNRRAQLQTLEPILIVMVLAIIASIGLVWFMRVSESSAAFDDRVFDTAQDLAMAKRIGGLPEISCPRDISAGTYCVDLEKAKAFSRAVSDQDTALMYRSLLGDSKIVLSWIDLRSGEMNNVTLYDMLPSDAVDISGSITYGSVYDPVSGERYFGMVALRRVT